MSYIDTMPEADAFEPAADDVRHDAPDEPPETDRLARIEAQLADTRAQIDSLAQAVARLEAMADAAAQAVAQAQDHPMLRTLFGGKG